MTSSKSSQTIVIALLSLWSIVSLIVIVVWATSPTMKSASQCQAELQEVTEKLEGAKVVWSKNKVALEEMVEEGRENVTQKQEEVQRLLQRMDAINVSLDACRQENVLLSRNISDLEQQIEEHRDMEANLTAQISLYQDQLETLHMNLTQAFNQTASCFYQSSAAVSQLMEAQKLTKSCHSSRQQLEKKLLTCNKADPQTHQQTTKNAANAITSFLPLVGAVCCSLRLLT
ncbi:uncharacterized protein si:ch211-1a19.3 [Lampris incognitus]|uniref:uncharacterized protein si:ch211-1a19.3 n=1 Tax=Lampris incognitus TaxID=2546036 RepID=UPI0024B50FE7|nr:uncharacterized protein si:ch211-1a19.3 [Lampris incognitus]